MATVRHVLDLDDRLSKKVGKAADNVQRAVAALRELDAIAGGAGASMSSAADGTDRAAKAAETATRELRKLAESTSMSKEQQAALGQAADKAAGAVRRGCHAMKSLTAEQIAAAKATKDEEQERQKLARALDKQRLADERVRLGKEQAQAVQEIRAIDDIIARKTALNDLTEEEISLLRRRQAQVRENLAIETGRAANLGTRIDRGFGAQGTRRSPIAGGVFSTHVGNVSKDLSSAAKETENLNRGMASLRQTVRYLPQQIGDVIQSIQAGQSPGRALSVQLSDVGFQLANAASEAGLFGKAIASIGSVGAPVLVFLGLLVTAYAVVQNAVERVTEATGRFTKRIDESAAGLAKAKKRVDETAGAFRELRDQTDETNRQKRVLLGLIEEEDGDLERVTARIREQAQEGLLAAGQSVANAQAEVNAIKDVLRSTETSVEEKSDAARKEKHANEDLAASRKVLADRRADVDAAELAAADLLFEKLTKKREEEAKRAKEQADRDAESARGRGESEARRAEQDAAKRAHALERLESIARKADTSQLDGIEAVNAALADQLDAIDDLIESRGRLSSAEQAAVARARGAVRAQAEAERQAIREKEASGIRAGEADLKAALDDLNATLRSGVLGRPGGAALGAVGALTQGNVTGAVQGGLSAGIGGLGAAATAAGAAGAGLALSAAALPVAAGIVGLKTLGEEGAAGIGLQAEEVVDAIVAGIGELPTLLVEVAPQIGVKLATELVPALLKLPYEFAKALGQAIADIFGSTRRQERRDRRQDRRAERRAERGFRSGTSLVDRDGSAYLHRGEAVVPVHGQGSQPVMERIRQEMAASSGPTVQPASMQALVIGYGRATNAYGQFRGRVGGAR